LKISETLLQELGYQVTALSDSTAALATFRRHPDRYDLLITDQTMPELTGRKLIEAVRRTHPAFPAILCTGFSNLINHDKALEEGINAFLEKPIELTQLAHTVRACLDKKSLRNN
jgi:DNA-binding NtrC family response regulator